MRLRTILTSKITLSSKPSLKPKSKLKGKRRAVVLLSQKKRNIGLQTMNLRKVRTMKLNVLIKRRIEVGKWSGKNTQSVLREECREETAEVCDFSKVMCNKLVVKILNSILPKKNTYNSLKIAFTRTKNTIWMR